MSGSTSVVTVAAAGGGGVGDGSRLPFTAGQWQELEHQALIYKYLVAGLPVPTDLVVPIRRSLDALSARFFQHPSLGYGAYYGKKFDPEPGRCRRTDGKKWRCSKDAYPESRYCERHMHRGRSRSRKPVESQSTSQSLSTVMSQITTASSSGSGCQQSVGSGSFHNLPLYSVGNSDGLAFGNNTPKYQVESSPYGISNKEYRYNQGVNDDNYSSEASGNIRGLGINSDVDSGWGLMTSSQVPSSSMLKSRNDSYLQGNTSQLSLPQSYEPITDASAAMSKQRQQYCFFGNEVSSAVPVKQDQHSAMRPFFDEWPKTRHTWSNLDDENKNAFSTTQLSISIPMASEFSTRSGCSPNDA